MAKRGYRALLIGNWTFPNDSQNLQDLEGPRNDVPLLRNALTDPEAGLFGPDDVRMALQGTMAETLVELEQFFSTASRDDRLLLYYSGHGLLDENNRLYLCARDTRTDLLKSTAVSSGAITMMIDGSAARTTIILLDCCHSGAFKGGSLPSSLRGAGRFVVTSSRSAQLANDATRLNRTSVFTQHVIDGLLSGASDTDGDGYVDLGEVYSYVYRKLEAEGRQIPQRNFSGGGDVAIARRSLQVKPPPAPPSSDQPVLQLSETVIDLRDITQGEVLPPERIDVRHRAGGRLDWTVETTADWVELHPTPNAFTLVLRPRPGMNRANVVVRDRMSGEAQTVRVRVHVVAEAPPKLELSTTEVDFGTLQHQASPPRRTLHLRNAGGGRLDPRVTTSHQWLHAAQEDDRVVLSIDTSVTGSLAGELYIDSQGGSARARVTAFIEPRPGWPPPRWAWVAASTLMVIALIATASVLIARGPGPATEWPPPPPLPITQNVTVPGNPPQGQWIDTGVDLKAGDAVTITATGEIDDDSSAKTLPFGPDGRQEPGHPGDPQPSLAHAVLLARIGESGAPFVVGSSSNFSASTDGRLHLSINDDLLDDNRGEYIATIQVTSP